MTRSLRSGVPYILLLARVIILCALFSFNSCTSLQLNYKRKQDYESK